MKMKKMGPKTKARVKKYGKIAAWVLSAGTAVLAIFGVRNAVENFNNLEQGNRHLRTEVKDLRRDKGNIKEDLIAARDSLNQCMAGELVKEIEQEVKEEAEEIKEQEPEVPVVAAPANPRPTRAAADTPPRRTTNRIAPTPVPAQPQTGQMSERDVFLQKVKNCDVDMARVMLSNNIELANALSSVNHGPTRQALEEFVMVLRANEARQTR